MKRQSVDFWLCAVASGLWLVSLALALATYPTVLSIAGSITLSVFFAFRAAGNWRQ